jgi:hypothetical protein
MTTRIELLWSVLRRQGIGAQRRVDATHPLDLYADFTPPDCPGLVLLTDARPPDAPSLKAIAIDRRQRQDGRWTLRISLEEPRLLAVFGELCRDIIAFTRTGVESSRAGGAVLSRIDRWRNLLQAEPAALGRSALRGLIGELLFLETLMPALGPDDAIHAWTGPLGTDQDFQLPSGLRIEVKALDRDANQVRINGLGQLDGAGHDLQLALVRLEDTGRDADGALTAALLVSRLRTGLANAPVALQNFEISLRFVGWNDTDDTSSVVVRLARIDSFVVNANFPRLTMGEVPNGVLDASYIIAVPPGEPTP